MIEKKWFETSFRRSLVDMHIPDWDEAFLKDFSPEEYAERMEQGGFDTVEIYAGNCLGLTFWPTEIGYRHRQLRGRDLLGETIAACRARGLGVVIYLNVWHRSAYEDHPEWRMIHADGLPSMEHFHYRFGVCCFNSGFGEFFLRLLGELNDAYECRGIWIDMIGWNQSVCYCPACRERFRRENGYDTLPRVVDWSDRHWLEFQRARENWLAEYAGKVIETVKKRTPERSVALQKAGMLTGWIGGAGWEFLRSGDYSAGDFTGDRIEQSCICKLFALFSRSGAVEFMTPRCENLLHHTTERDPEALKMRGYAAVANQAAFTLIDAINPDGTLPPHFYARARSIHAEVGAYAKYLDGTSHPVADIGIYFSADSLLDAQPFPYPIESLKTMDEGCNPQLLGWKNMARSFEAEHWLYGFAGRDTRLEQFSVVVAADLCRLSHEECERLVSYVAGGGKLYASGRTSLYDPETGKRADFALAELFGVHYAGAGDGGGAYLVGHGDPLFSPDAPVWLETLPVRITAAPDSEVPGTLAEPWSQSGELRLFGSAISNPPKSDSGLPGLVRHRFGLGEVIYCAGTLEAMSYDWHRKWFAALLKELLPEPRVRTELPGSVEFTLFDQPESRRYILNCLNYPADLPSPEYRHIPLELRLPERRISRVVAVDSDGMERVLPFTCEGVSVRFELDRLGAFALLALEYL